MRAVGGLGQAADVLAHGVAPDPEPPGDLPQGEALDPTKVLTRRPYSPARLISSSGRIRPSPFPRAVAVVRASSRKSATCLPGEPPGTPGTRSRLFQEGVFAEFPPPRWQVCRRHCQHDMLGDDPKLLQAPKARPRRQSEAPIRYLPVPHSAHTARSAGRPFFIVTRSTSRDGVFTRHFRQ